MQSICEARDFSARRAERQVGEFAAGKPTDRCIGTVANPTRHMLRRVAIERDPIPRHAMPKRHQHRAGLTLDARLRGDLGHNFLTGKQWADRLDRKARKIPQAGPALARGALPHEDSTIFDNNNGRFAQFRVSLPCLRLWYLALYAGDTGRTQRAKRALAAVWFARCAN